jgi:membrane protease subunit (stomatin/prohibitin family)
MKYLVPNAPVFDFADLDNDAGAQLFSEVVGSLAGAFSNYTNDPEKGNRMSRIQGDSVGFGQSLAQAVEDNFQWVSGRGLQVERVVIKAIEYDEGTKALMAQVREADAMGGARANTFMQMAAARGVEAMGSNPNGGGGMGMAFMGMGANAAGNMMGGMMNQNAQPNFQVGQGLQQQQQPAFDPMTGQPLQQQQPMFDPMTGQPLQQAPQQQPMFDPMTGQPLQQQAPVQQAAPAQEDPVARLTQMKQLLDAGVISQEEFDAARNQFLGL